MKVEWIEHKGEKVLFVNFRRVKDQSEMISIVEEYHSIVKEYKGKVKSLYDVTDAAINTVFVNRAKELGKEDAEKLEKTSTIGVKKMEAFLFRGYNLYTKNQSPITPFRTKEKALEYLVS